MAEEHAASSDQLLQDLLADTNHTEPPCLNTSGVLPLSSSEEEPAVDAPTSLPLDPARLQPTRTLRPCSAEVHPAAVHHRHQQHLPSYSQQPRPHHRHHHQQQSVSQQQRFQQMQPLKTAAPESRHGVSSLMSSDDEASDAALAAVLDAPSGSAVVRPAATAIANIQIPHKRQTSPVHHPATSQLRDSQTRTHDSMARPDPLAAKHPSQNARKVHQGNQQQHEPPAFADVKQFQPWQGSSGVFSDSDDDGDAAVLAALEAAERQQKDQQHGQEASDFFII